MTAQPGPDERRAQHYLRAHGVAYVPQPTAPAPTRPEEDPMPWTIAFFAFIAAVVTAAVVILRRPTARDTAVLAGAMLGICAHALLQCVWNGGRLDA